MLLLVCIHIYPHYNSFAPTFFIGDKKRKRERLKIFYKTREVLKINAVNYPYVLVQKGVDCFIKNVFYFHCVLKPYRMEGRTTSHVCFCCDCWHIPTSYCSERRHITSRRLHRWFWFASIMLPNRNDIAHQSQIYGRNVENVNPLLFSAHLGSRKLLSTLDFWKKSVTFWYGIRSTHSMTICEMTAHITSYLVIQNFEKSESACQARLLWNPLHTNEVM